MGLNRAARERVRRLVERRLGKGAAALPFAAAVAVQLVQSEPHAETLPDGRLQTVFEPVLVVLRALEAGEAGPVEEKLASDPILLSAFFQNIDLLYEHDYAAADAVSRVTLQALHDASVAEEKPS